MYKYLYSGNNTQILLKPPEGFDFKHLKCTFALKFEPHFFISGNLLDQHCFAAYSNFVLQETCRCRIRIITYLTEKYCTKFVVEKF